MDKDAQKDFTYRMSQDEYLRHKKNWWISLNTSGRNEPMELRSDFSEALTKLHRLHRESGEERLAPIPSALASALAHPRMHHVSLTSSPISFVAVFFPCFPSGHVWCPTVLLF